MNFFGRSSSTTPRASPAPPGSGGGTASPDTSVTSMRGMPRPSTVSGGLSSTTTSGSLSPAASGSPQPAYRRSPSFTTSAAQLMSLSGVLNDPKAAKFGKLDLGGAHVPPVPIKKVRLADFDAYIKAISGYYDRYHYHRIEGVAAVTQGAPALHAPVTHLAAAGADEDVASSPSVPLSNLLGRASASGSRAPTPAPAPPPPPGHPLDPLDAVPRVFFEDDFNMENPRVFDLVTTGIELGDLDALEFPLSRHLEIIEAHLVREISQRSTSFFTALSNLNALHDETVQCLAQIQQLDAQLKTLALVHSKRALETVYMTQRRQNVAKLYETVKAMSAVRQAYPMIQVLLQQGDYVGALDLIAESHQALAGTGLRDLRGVKTMGQFKVKLLDLSKTIGQSMEADLCDALLNHTRVPHLARNELQHRLAPLVVGLIRIEGLSRAITTYQDKLLGEVNQTIRKSYPPDTLVEPTASPANKHQLSRTMKTLTLEEFMAVLQSVCRVCDDYIHMVTDLHRVLEACIKLADAQHVAVGGDKDMVGARTSPAPPPPPPLPNSPPRVDTSSSCRTSTTPSPPTRTTAAASPTDSPPFRQFVAASRQVTHVVADLCHSRCAALLTARGDQSAQLSLKDYTRLYQLASDFIRESEACLQDHAATGLKSALQAQSRAFMTHFHMERMKQLGMLIENENWGQSDVLIDFQVLADAIVDAHPASPNSAGVATATASSRRKRMLHSDSNGSLQSLTANNKYLFVGDDQFPVASVVLMLGKMLSEYLQCLDTIPALAMDVHQKVTELLKLFNKRACDMILGAGAVQSAGLKSITAKHLAITAQSLAAVMALIPHLRRAIAHAMVEKQTVFLTEYDRVLKDYADHQQGVYAKLVAIMEERVMFHCHAFGAVDWESQPVPDEHAATLPPPTPSMEALVKETTTLHKVLSRYLPGETLRSVMQAVFRAYSVHLEHEVQGIRLYSVAAKNALLIDVQFFIRKLNALEGVDGPGSSLEVVVNNMRILDRSAVPQSPVAPAPAPGTPEGTMPRHAGGTASPSSDHHRGSVASLSGSASTGPANVAAARNMSPVPPSTGPLPPPPPLHDLPNAPSPAPASTSSTTAGSAAAAGMKFPTSMSSFNIKSFMGTSGPTGGTSAPAPTGNYAPMSTAAGVSNSSSTLPGAAPHMATGSGAPPGAMHAVTTDTAAAVAREAATKTKQIATDWMKKMTFMKGGATE
ncbi:hypothetical protein AMAG_13408 [Allomyces macrogynus ATCC 38327]|uniref:Vacuolar protein sorting-associated protein 54 n=1 Tax=Allomyces macrogynus (strain ATCC 38327) TaxID=578462 RepID=A0A0L0T1P8_ALLM3|nr:hypothetical protein AMAG_13408 [Allomyces macrogynus ATCC 38327]|eukprot:KNE68768.1 hypothetical protein AMAG_13408 [Allomyces macrogynus ATCC 38327]